MFDFHISNNVKTTLASGVGATDTVITVNQASAPFNNPVSPGSQKCRFTIVDFEIAPTKIEIIEASSVSAVGGGGIITLSGVTRGKEGTTAHAWSGGSVIFQAITAETITGGNFGLTSSFDATGHEDEWGNAHNYFVQSQVDTLITRLTPDVRLDIDADQITGKSIVGTTIVPLGSLVMAPSASADMQGLTTVAKLCIAGDAPSSSSSAIDRAGVIRVNANYIYVSVGLNNWKRVALSSF